jgi:aminoglycoside/choline kinase family phosphotransferase
MENDTRRAELRRWIGSAVGLDVTDMVPASADASFRRYFRVFVGADRYIAMDAPPVAENSEPFVRVARYLEAIGLNSPRIIGADLGKGFLLLTDLGERQYLDELRARPASAAKLYGDALHAL